MCRFSFLAKENNSISIVFYFYAAGFFLYFGLLLLLGFPSTLSINIIILLCTLYSSSSTTQIDRYTTESGKKNLSFSMATKQHPTHTHTSLIYIYYKIPAMAALSCHGFRGGSLVVFFPYIFLSIFSVM